MMTNRYCQAVGCYDAVESTNGTQQSTTSDAHGLHDFLLALVGSNPSRLNIPLPRPVVAAVYILCGR